MTGPVRLPAAAAAATALAASALLPVFQSGRWLPATLGAVVVVFATGLAVRTAAGGRRLIQRFAPLVDAVALSGYLTAVFAQGNAHLGWIPGRAALSELADRARSGFADIHDLAAPVPTHPGLVLLTAAGVGVVALVVDTVAVGWRRAPLAGLPLLALYAVPAAVLPGGTGIVPFALGVVGLLGLLAVDHQVRLDRWGHRLDADREVRGLLAAASYSEPVPTGAVGRRIGAAAVGLALVIPAFVPMRALTFGTGAGAGVGATGTVVTYNPIVRLKGDLTLGTPIVLMRIRTNDPHPLPYLKMAGLDLFTGQTWAQSPLQAADPPVSAGLPPPGVRGPVYRTTISVSRRLGVHWLPLPYQPLSVLPSTGWRYDAETGTAFALDQTVRGLTYRVSNERLDVRARALADSPPVGAVPGFTQYLSVPSNLPPLVAKTVSDVTASARTPYERALAIQHFFTKDFRYSLSVPAGNSTNDIVNFLTVRQGFCEQFAATMALFARMVGIPARVAVGFTYGQRQRDGSYVVTTRDAHAWPELYFAGTGWLPFDPTPVAGRQGAEPPAYTRSPTLSGGTGVGPTTPGGSAPNIAKPPSIRENPYADSPPGSAGSTPTTPTDPPTARNPAGASMALAGLLGLLVLTPALLRIGRERRRWRQATTPTGQARAAWNSLRDANRDLGWSWPTGASPRTVGARLRSRLPVDPALLAALDRVVTGQERMRYARVPPETADLEESARAVREALFRSAGRRRRWRARLLPVSSLDGLRGPARRAADLLDRFDLLVATVRRWRPTRTQPGSTGPGR